MSTLVSAAGDPYPLGSRLSGSNSHVRVGGYRETDGAGFVAYGSGASLPVFRLSCSRAPRVLPHAIRRSPHGAIHAGFDAYAALLPRLVCRFHLRNDREQDL